MKYLDLTGLREVWANIKSYISSKIPTKTSQLQNDSSYATTSQLPSKTSQLTNDSDFTTNAKLATKQDTINDLATIRSGASKGATAVQPATLNSYAKTSAIPTKTSQLTNDSGFLTSTDISNKADKATTLSGYGIKDAYTKTQVDKKVSDLVNSAPETLDTLNELASALGNDPNFATTVANQIGTKANDNNVVHKSGNETIKGVKNFNNVVLGESDGVIRIGNNGQGNHFCTLNYDGQIYNTLKQFVPTTTNEYYLGTSSNKWKDVYAITFNGNLVGNVTGNCSGTAGGVAWANVSGRPTKVSQFTNDSGYLTSGNVVDRTSNQTINGDKTFNNLIRAQNSLIAQNTEPNRLTHIFDGWIEMSNPGYCYIDFKHAGNQDFLGRIALEPNNVFSLGTLNGAPIMANGKNIVRSVNGVNADNNGNVTWYPDKDNRNIYYFKEDNLKHRDGKMYLSSRTTNGTWSVNIPREWTNSMLVIIHQGTGYCDIKRTDANINTSWYRLGCTVSSNVFMSSIENYDSDHVVTIECTSMDDEWLYMYVLQFIRGVYRG